MAELKIISMRDVESEEVSWLWKPYIPFGKITIVQGDPGQGKTTMTLAIASAVTKGEALPNGSASSPANVLFQTAEDGIADTIKPRLENLGADCSKVYFIDEEEESLSLTDERIEQAIIKKDAKLLILDPLQAYLGGADFNSAHGVRPLMKVLAGIAERTDCAVVIIGHLNKSKGKSAYRGLGSIDIYAAARSVLTVGKFSENENMRAVVQGKSNLAPAGKAMTFELDPASGFKWRGEADVNADDVINGNVRPMSQFARARKLIETVLGDGYEVAATEIIERAEAEGISYKTLNRAKTELGVITFKKNNKWYWQLPVEANFTESQDGQDRQGGQQLLLTTLSI